MTPRLIALLVAVGCTPGDGDSPPVAATQAAWDALTCVMPRGPLPANASLEGMAGMYDLTMVEAVDGNPMRTVDGSLLLLDQIDVLREFDGGLNGPVPGVASPLYGATNVPLADIGAVQVGILSSEDPASPGVLVIERETGASPNIQLRLGSSANRRTTVRFSRDSTVLAVLEITAESFSGTWTSRSQEQDADGIFCAVRSR